MSFACNLYSQVSMEQDYHDAKPLPLLQGLPPVLPKGQIRALVLGSFPSLVSLELQQYYGHAQNWFWRILAHCLVVDSAGASYTVRIAEVQARGLAIWDLYAHVRRQGSGDDCIHDVKLNALGELLAERGTFPILLNGRRAREWRRYYGNLKARVIELPSTSPRPLHWNTPQSRGAALAEWHAALCLAGVVPR